MLLGEVKGRGAHMDVEISLKALGEGGNVERRAAIQVMLVSGDIASDCEESRSDRDSETWKSAILKGEVGGG